MIEMNCRSDEHELRRFFHLSLDMLCIAGTDGFFKRINPAFENVLGWSQDELLGSPFVDFVHPHDVSATIREVEQLATGALTLSFENRYRCKDGRYKPIHWTCRPDSDRGLLYAVGRDNSERKRFEDQLRHRQRLEELGRFSGGIAHDFNNLLTSVMGSADLALLSGSGAAAMKALAEIRKATERAASLTRQLLAFSRQQVLSRKIVDLNQVVRDAETIIHPILGGGVHLELALDSFPTPVEGDPAQLEQALVNLVVNASDAMPAGGTLRIATRHVVPSRLPFPLPRRPHVVLEVTDSGCGIPLELQGQVFDPFFSTKPSDRGTGLGLATVDGIVQQHGGHIEMESRPEQGTTFLLYFETKNRLTQRSEAPKTNEILGGKETILVVEDNDAVRQTLAQGLRQWGYSVLEADSGARALEILETESERVDLVVADLIMPGLGGDEVARRAREQKPDQKVLFVSGYSADLMVQRGVLEEGAQLLHKPFSPAELARAVRKACDEAE